jgi:hypothetical protein
VFSNQDVIDLASERFVPVAENSSALERQTDDKGEFFRHVAEQGHYGGRTFPTSTRQGSYTFLADGTFLASINSTDPEKMAGMLRDALDRFAKLGELGAPSPAQLVDTRPEDEGYPADGLVLQATVRDLPRPADQPPPDHKWNLDYVWIRSDEARALVPEPIAAGTRRDWPENVVRRLARFHLRDYVRGEPFNWPEEAIRHAEIASEIVAVDGDAVRLVLRGAVRLEADVAWVAPEDGETKRYDNGFDCQLYGEATWDAARERFTAFALVAAGERWGTNQYNFRYDDLGPAPIGIAFELAGTTPGDRTAPHCLRTWRAGQPPSNRPSRVSVPAEEYYGG